jgi:hypothetical protein
MSPYATLLFFGAIGAFIIGLICGNTLQGLGLIVFSGLCLVAEAITNMATAPKGENR